MGSPDDSSRQGSFARVVAAYEARLLRYVARLTGNASAAEDIVQETLVRLARRWREPMEPSPQLQGWLYRVAHNEAVDYARREARRNALHLRHAKEQETLSPSVAQPAGGAGDGYGEVVSEALRSLSDRERELVTLKVYEGRSYKEIAEITGLTVGNVGYILHHAMRKLAAMLADGEEKPR
ncbi:MAG: RNA polymerase sigma factor [Kiritimatiellia bacterium]|jgi:RNA polymerase sigma factor (sigma-70 family)